MALIDKETWDRIPDSTKYEACETMLDALMHIASAIVQVHALSSAGMKRLQYLNNTFKELNDAMQENNRPRSEEDSSQAAGCGCEAAEREELAGD